MPTNTDKSHKSKPEQDTSGFQPALLSAGESLVKALKGAAPPTPLEAYDAAEKQAEVQAAVAEFAVPQEAPKHKQPWYRPPDSKARKLYEKIAVMRAAGHDDATIAKRLKTTEQSVRQYVYLAKKNGWADDEGEPINVELELANSIDAKVVRNISASLDGQMTNWQTHEMTIAAAKGRGMFKNHEKNEGAVVMAPVAIQIIMPALGENQQRMEIPDSMMGGTPAFVDGEVVDGADGHGTGRVELGRVGAPALEASAAPLQRQPE